MFNKTTSRRSLTIVFNKTHSKWRQKPKRAEEFGSTKKPSCYLKSEETLIQLQLKSCTRKKPTWLEIAAYLRAAGYEDRDDGSCKTRIRTLISAYS